MASLVSVIVPVYNVSPYLRQCMDSIVNQTLKDIEIICVDDGSTDDSLAILQEYAEHDSRITILQQENKGSGPARNLGIRYANGEYLAFVDPDDWYPDNTVLEYLHNVAKKNNALICGGNLIIWNESMKIFENLSTQKIFFSEGFIDYKNYQFPTEYLRFIFNRLFLINNNIQFPAYLRGQDAPFMAKAASTAGVFYALPIDSYCYRTMHKKINWDIKKYNDYLRTIRDLLVIAVNKNYQYLHTITIRLYFGTYIMGVRKNLDKANPDFSNIITEINSLIQLQWNVPKKPNWIDRNIISKYTKLIYYNSPSKKSKKIISMIKCYILLSYWKVCTKIWKNYLPEQ